MSSRATVHSLVQRALSGPEWDDLFRWGSGSQRSDVCEHIAGRMVRTRWNPSDGVVPKYRQALGAGAAEAAQALIVSLLPSIRAAVEVQRKVVEFAVDTAREAGARDSAASFSERACSAVGTAYAQDPPEVVDIEYLGRSIGLARQDRPRRLEKPAFGSAYREAYRRQLAATGVRALAEFPPLDIGLGSNQSPPFDAPINENSWRLGSDRSVWGRYRLHFLVKARSCSGPADTKIHQADACAVEEVRRSCQGYGLTRPEHRVVLRSISTAPVEAGPEIIAAANRTWRDWRAEVRQVDSSGTSDLRLTAAVAARTTIWFRKASPGRDLIARFGPAENYQDLVSRALVRKLWMGLHRLEREHEPPADSDQLNPLLFAALDKAVPEAVTSWLTEVSSTAPSTARVDGTAVLLLRHPDLASRLRTWLPATLDEYTELAHSQYGPQWHERLLRLDELKDLIVNHPNPEES